MKICLECQHRFCTDGWLCPVCGYDPVKLNGIVAHAAELADGGSGFKSEYFARLAGLEESNFWFQARNKFIVWALHTYMESAQAFLEVGCGTGFVLSGIAETHPGIALSGSEIFIEGLSFAAERVPSASFMQMDARRVPFLEEYDAVGAFDVLEHIVEDEVVLGQLFNALKPGGVLLLTVPQHPWLWSAADEYACHVRRYTSIEIETKVKNAGFRLLRSTSFVSLLLPAMMLSRHAHKKNEFTFDPEDEFNLNSVLSRILEGLMVLEISGIKAGINYSVGGSRLVVAEKS